MLKSLYKISSLAVTLLITAILGTTIVNAQSVTTVDNAQSTNLSTGWSDSWLTGSIANVYSPTDNVTSFESLNLTQLHTAKMEFLKSIKGGKSGNNKNRSQTSSIQPLSSSSAWGLVTVAVDYNNIAYNAADHIVTAGYYGGGDALKGTSDTPSNAVNYWKSDTNLCYYTNIGESSPFVPGSGNSDCYYLRFNDGNGGSQPLSYGTVQYLSPDTGLYGADVYIDSCYSWNNPMYNAFQVHSPNFYIGGKVILPATTSTNVCDRFWTTYNCLGDPTQDLNDACEYYSEPNTDYGLIYYNHW